MRIRSRLLVLVLAVLVPAFLTAVLGISYIYRKAQEDNRQNMREITRAMALVVDKDLAKREAILQTLGNSPALEQGDLNAFYQQAHRIAPGPDTAILLHDASGRVLLNTRRLAIPGGQPRPSLMQDLRQRYGPDATVVSNLFFSPTGQANSFAVQLPVRRENGVSYYLQMSVFANELQAVFEEQKLPEDWIGSIIDRNGVVVARSRDAARYVGKQTKGTVLEKIAGGDHFHEGKSLSGEPVSAYFSRAPLSEWTFVVSVPKRHLQQSAVRATATIGAISFCLLVLAIGIAFALGRVTAIQIEGLRRAAKRLGAGLPVMVERSGVWEIDAVNAALVKASEDLDRNQAEMARRVEEAVVAVQRSQLALVRSQKLEALGRLTGGIAHDFNNILQTLTTGLQIAAYSAAEPRAASALETCLRSVDRASDLVRQLMAFGRVQEARLETVDLGRQLAAMTPMLKSGLSDSIALHIEVAEGLWPVTMDPLQFELALLNLTINARDAMPSGGTIRVRASNYPLEHGSGELAPGDYVCLTVGDTGPGMAEETLARAFEPFFTTKSVGQGSGLGLPQAYGFARQSGGLLTLDSGAGKGTTATFYLPRACQPAIRPAPAAQPTVLAKPAAAAAAAAAILLVEDDPLVRSVIGPALATFGFMVTEAQGGEEAMRLLEAGAHFDLVLSDIVMPGKISGIDLAELITQRYPDIGVVLATGYSERRLQLPNIRILAKPYDIAEMLNVLNSELREKQAA